MPGCPLLNDKFREFLYFRLEGKHVLCSHKAALNDFPPSIVEKEEKGGIMFPAEFDRKILESLPLISDSDVQRINRLLRHLIIGRIFPYFKKHRGTDPVTMARIEKNLEIGRLEDEEEHVGLASLITQDGTKWIINIHERVFDYIAFVVPSNKADWHADDSASDELKALALSEFLLRHQVEHILYRQKSARELLQSDVAFMLDKKTSDPTYYKTLRRAMNDPMNGVICSGYVEILELIKEQSSTGAAIDSMIRIFAELTADLPENLLHKVFPHLDLDLKTKVLGTCYHRSGDNSRTLLTRALYLKKVLKLFYNLNESDEGEAEQAFDKFKQMWGLVHLFREVQLPIRGMEDTSSRELFEQFRSNLKSCLGELDGLAESREPTPQVHQPRKPAATVKSLVDRIQEAKDNPLVPREAILVIEKNKLNLVGQSSAKYTEYIETLLAVPWGKIKKIDVPVETFEEDLDNSHYGLKKPKEIVSDFFANLIWRYRDFVDTDIPEWKRKGSAFLFVGPPGVGKTSLAISIAKSLSIPYHKISLGGMADESELRGHGFTYEGSKPGAIIQGLIRMGVMNGMFIMDEVDKVEKFAVATLLEILDPEQNHLFHDKYLQTNVDVDLSNCNFILTGNTLETIPPAVLNRCEVIVLDRYSVDEKIQIAKKYLVNRVMEKHGIQADLITFDSQREEELLRHIIKNYTYEAGVRQLERVIRTLFLRSLRKDVLGRIVKRTVIGLQQVKSYLESPRRPQKLNDQDAIGEVMGLGVNPELGLGSLIPIQVTAIASGKHLQSRSSPSQIVYATGNIEKIMDESRTVAMTAVMHCADMLEIEEERIDSPMHFHFMGAATPKDGPSAGSAIGLALASLLSKRPIRRDIAVTGEIDTQGRITMIGGLDIKLETAYEAGCKTVIVPRQNLEDENLLDRFQKIIGKEAQILTYKAWKTDAAPFDGHRHGMQVIGIDHLLEAAEISFIYREDLESYREKMVRHAELVIRALLHRVNTKLCVPFLKDFQEISRYEALDENHPYFCLISPRAKNIIDRRFPEWVNRVFAFDSQLQDPSAAFEVFFEKFAEMHIDFERLAIIGPFSFLLKIKPDLEKRFPEQKFLFLANNETLQYLKIGECKPTLNIVYGYLAQLSTSELLDCFFLGQRDGVHLIDLRYIAEKYRLDSGRASQMLEADLNAWLKIIENAGVNLSETQPDEIIESPKACSH